MVVSDMPFPHPAGHGVAPGRGPDNKASGQAPTAPRAVVDEVTISEAALAAGPSGTTGVRLAGPPAHQAQALIDSQGAQDESQAKLPFGHVVRLLAHGLADAAAALLAPSGDGEPALDDGATGGEVVVAGIGEAEDTGEEPLAVAGEAATEAGTAGTADPPAPEAAAADIITELLDALSGESAEGDGAKA